MQWTFKHLNHTFLAGSPDGLVPTSTGESGLIKIKNIHIYIRIVNSVVPIHEKRRGL